MSDAAVHLCASALASMKADRLFVENWIGSMDSGAYKYGFGLLRSDEDAFDAMGVLVAIHDNAGWSWDQDEGAWAYDDDAYEVRPSKAFTWLSADTADSYKLECVERLMREVVTLNDGATSFEPIIKLLRDALKRWEQEAARLESDARQSMTTGSRARFDPYYDRSILGYRR